MTTEKDMIAGYIVRIVYNEAKATHTVQSIKYYWIDWCLSGVLPAYG